MSKITAVETTPVSDLPDRPEPRRIVIMFDELGTPSVKVIQGPGEYPLSRREFNLADRALKVARKNYDREIIATRRSKDVGVTKELIDG